MVVYLIIYVTLISQASIPAIGTSGLNSACDRHLEEKINPRLLTEFVWTGN